MASAPGKPSLLACAGMACGVLLLTFAGSLIVVAPSYLFPGAVDLPNVVRRLAIAPIVPAPVAAPIVPAPVAANVLGSTYAPTAALVTPPAAVAKATGLAIPSTSTPPSSFDVFDSSSSGSSFEPSKSSESGSFQSSGLPGEEIGGSWAAAGSGTVLQLVIMLCFAICYKAYAVDLVLDERGTLKAMNLPDSGNDDFENGVCECSSDRWVCLHAVCCPVVRVAHTNAVAGICGFWETALCWGCCSCMTLGMGPWLLLVYWRQRLKVIMGVQDHPLNDFCVTLFCPLLSICQMGTAVDTKLGYQVIGCCDLEWHEEDTTTPESQRLISEPA